MRELVEYIVKAIVNAPDNVVVTEEESVVSKDNNMTVIKVEVADDDKGRVIGKEGRVAEAMRTLLRVIATRAGVRVKLEII